jgi:hypothetical protein
MLDMSDLDLTCDLRKTQKKAFLSICSEVIDFDSHEPLFDEIL